MLNVMDMNRNFIHFIRQISARKLSGCCMCEGCQDFFLWKYFNPLYNICYQSFPLPQDDVKGSLSMFVK